MTLVDASFARHFADAWVRAWNAHDLDAVLVHYTDDFQLESPMIPVFTGGAMAHLEGKAAVRAYWAAALQRLPTLHFELVDVLLGMHCLTLYYRGHKGLVAETFFFDDAGKVNHATVAYALD